LQVITDPDQVKSLRYERIRILNTTNVDKRKVFLMPVNLLKYEENAPEKEEAVTRGVEPAPVIALSPTLPVQGKTVHSTGKFCQIV